jgi:hypothetical protein
LKWEIAGNIEKKWWFGIVKWTFQLGLLESILLNQVLVIVNASRYAMVQYSLYSFSGPCVWVCLRFGYIGGKGFHWAIWLKPWTTLL